MVYGRLDAPTLDCQTCGEVIRRLTNAEVAVVADNPYKYVVDCFECRKAMRL